MFDVTRKLVFTFFFVCTYAHPQLEMLNVIFRHGDRTPAVKAIFPNDPYYHSDFYPYGLGGLTNAGKVRAYKLGEFLRDRYKNFLGDVYLPERLYARSSEYDRTIMSLQLVLAALYPPKNVQKWHELLDWQPIPFSYSPRHDDKLIATVNTNEFDLGRKVVEQKKDIKERLDQFGSFMLELSNLTGKNINNSLEMKRIYETLMSEKHMNLTLPNWTKDMFPDGKLFEALLLDYEIITYDDRILNSLVGNLMSEITNNMLAITNNTERRKTKISLYSGHEFNIVAALKSLKAHQIHLPEYSSAVIIELFRIGGEYFVKVIYYQGVSSEVLELKIAGCSDLCPFDKYLTTVNSVIQSHDDV